MFASAYSVKERVFAPIYGDTRTKQSMAAECNINNIMKKYQKTGAVSHLAKHGAEYGFATELDFSQSMRVVAKAQSMFEDLPSSIRTKFSNDPGQFLAFVQDTDNLEEMADLGLVERLPVEVISEPVVANDPASGEPVVAAEPPGTVVP